MMNSTIEKARDMIERWKTSAFPVECIVVSQSTPIRYRIVGYIMECNADLVIRSSDDCLATLLNFFSAPRGTIEVEISESDNATTIRVTSPSYEVHIRDIDIRAIAHE